MCDMLRVGVLLVAAVCLALSSCAASQEVDACGPLYLDPNTLGGLRHRGGLAFCNGTLLYYERAHDAIDVKGWRALHHMEWFGILPNCSQVALGVSVNRNVEGGLRGNTNSVGIFFGSNKAYWGFPETPTKGGLNQDFTGRLASVGKKSKGFGVWIMVNYETGLLWYAKTGMEPISFGLPETFKGRALYPHVQAWDSNYVEVLHPSPLMSISCPDSLQINKDTFTTLDPRPIDPDNFKGGSTFIMGPGPRNAEYARVNSVKANSLLNDDSWISVNATNDEGDYGIGVSIYPFKAGNGMISNPYSFGFQVGDKLLHGFNHTTGMLKRVNMTDGLAEAKEDVNNRNARIKVNYTGNKIHYAHPLKEPIVFSLPEIFEGKPLFPFIEVWNEGGVKFVKDRMGAKG